MNLEPVKNFKKPLYAVAAAVALSVAVTGCTDPMEEVKSHFTLLYILQITAIWIAVIVYMRNIRII